MSEDNILLKLAEKYSEEKDVFMSLFHLQNVTLNRCKMLLA